MNLNHKRALKDATKGLIGDGATHLKAKEIKRRFADQCKRLGVYDLSWALFVELVRSTNYLRWNTMDIIDVLNPVIREGQEEIKGFKYRIHCDTGAGG